MLSGALEWPLPAISPCLGQPVRQQPTALLQAFPATLCPEPGPGGSQALPIDSRPGSVPNVCHLGKEGPLPKTPLGTLGPQMAGIPKGCQISRTCWVGENLGVRG